MATSDGSPPVGGVRADWIGSVVAWIAVWLGTGVALGGSGQFGKVLPILVVGNLIGLGADGLPGHRRLLGPAVVWAVLLAGVMIVLGQSPYLGRELVVLAAGALWFVGVGPLVVSTGTGVGRPAPARAGSREARTRRPGYLTTLLADSHRPVRAVGPVARVTYAATPGPPRHAHWKVQLEGGDKACFACSRGSG
jgi:hypothetical protein